MKAIVTPSNSPYTVVLPVDSSSLTNEAINIDVSGEVIIILPALSSLPQTFNQKVNIVNLSSNAQATIQPAAADSVGNSGTGVAFVGPSGTGASTRIQPQSAVNWSANNASDSTPL